MSIKAADEAHRAAASPTKASGQIGNPPSVADATGAADAIKLSQSPFPSDAIDPMTPVIIDAPPLTPPRLSTPDDLAAQAKNLSKFQAAVKKITLGLLGFALFYVALGLMKDGAQALIPLMRDWLSIGNLMDSMDG